MRKSLSDFWVSRCVKYLGKWELSESVSPVSRSYGCFCSSCRSLNIHTRLRGWKEFVYSGVSLSYLFCLLGSSRSPASLYVDGRIGRHQSSFLRLLQVLQLDSQVCKQCYPMISVLFVPQGNMQVLELVGIQSDVLTS
jgi:hypothetical protein